MKTNHGKRGMYFENMLNYTNQTYINQGRAVINKRATPMKIIGKTKGNQHICVFDQKSTTDYDGVYKGKPIVFEAKSTNKKRLPFDMISDHQIDYLEQAEKQGAISFLIVDMKATRETYLIPNNMLQKYIRASQVEGGRKSIPLRDLEVYAHLVGSQNGVPLDYLSVVDRLIAAETA